MADTLAKIHPKLNPHMLEFCLPSIRRVTVTPQTQNCS
jgi:hypothetical protein